MKNLRCFSLAVRSGAMQYAAVNIDNFTQMCYEETIDSEQSGGLHMRRFMKCVTACFLAFVLVFPGLPLPFPG